MSFAITEQKFRLYHQEHIAHTSQCCLSMQVRGVCVFICMYIHYIDVNMLINICNRLGKQCFHLKYMYLISDTNVIERVGGIELLLLKMYVLCAVSTTSF